MYGWKGRHQQMANISDVWINEIDRLLLCRKLKRQSKKRKCKYDRPEKRSCFHCC